MNGSPKSIPPGRDALGDAGNVATLQALTHPLPAGMRDGLPGEARQQARLTRVVMRAFELYGYERVQLPALEYSEVLALGRRILDPHSVLRFVEPETGEVVALRPDMTPQVARLVTTRLADAPMPARLCYQGSVLRRRRERARNNQQIPQAGIELIGVPGQAGDLEVVQAAAAALRASGLERFIIDLGHSDIAPSLLRPIPQERWHGVVDALAQKDQAALLRRAERLGLSGARLRALVALPELHGAEELWARAEPVLRGTAAERPAMELMALWRAVTDGGLDVDVTLDFGETWRFDYYTGPMFQLLGEGPGLPIGSGGRYDALYARFGVERPAAGCAIDLDNLGWACRFGRADEDFPIRLLVAGEARLTRGLLDQLRAEHVVAAPAPEAAELEYAKAWRYSHLLQVSEAGAHLCDVRSETTTRVVLDATQIARDLRSLRKKTHGT